MSTFGRKKNAVVVFLRKTKKVISPEMYTDDGSVTFSFVFFLFISWLIVLPGRHVFLLQKETRRISSTTAKWEELAHRK